MLRPVKPKKREIRWQIWDFEDRGEGDDVHIQLEKRLIESAMLSDLVIDGLLPYGQGPKRQLNSCGKAWLLEGSGFQATFTLYKNMAL